MTSLQEQAEQIAQLVGLSGVANIQGFVNADTGELSVQNVDTVPSLHSGCLIFKQVTHHMHSSSSSRLWSL